MVGGPLTREEREFLFDKEPPSKMGDVAIAIAIAAIVIAFAWNAIF